jgi:hypothetical protein
MQSFFCENCERETISEISIYTEMDEEEYQLTQTKETTCSFCGWGTEETITEEMC